MENTSFPVKGEKCRNPQKCLYRHKKIQEQFNLSRHIVEKKLDAFLKQKDWRNQIKPSNHAKKRMVDRAIGNNHIYEVIEHGEPIACEGDKNSHAIMGRAKVGVGSYRTVHVLIRFEEQKMKIITVYDPSYSPYLYDEAFECRICWCEPHPSDF